MARSPESENNSIPAGDYRPCEPPKKETRYFPGSALHIQTRRDDTDARIRIPRSRFMPARFLLLRSGRVRKNKQKTHLPSSAQLVFS